MSFEANPSPGAITFQLLRIYQPPLLTVTDQTKLWLLMALGAVMGDPPACPGSLATIQRSTGQGLYLTAPTRPVWKMLPVPSVGPKAGAHVLSHHRILRHVGGPALLHSLDERYSCFPAASPPRVSEDIMCYSGHRVDGILTGHTEQEPALPGPAGSGPTAHGSFLDQSGPPSTS